MAVLRQAFEKGMASVMARWMLDHGSDAVFERIARANALTPEALEQLKKETRVYLEKVREEGAPYSEAVLTVWQEVAKHLPDFGAVTQTAGRVALQVAARSAEVAAARAQDLAEQLRAAQAAPIDEAAPRDDAEDDNRQGDPSEDDA